MVMVIVKAIEKRWKYKYLTNNHKNNHKGIKIINKIIIGIEIVTVEAKVIIKIIEK